ncbi:MAG: HEAT repeat domain-containing protein [Saprospiraceae bacterium]
MPTILEQASLTVETKNWALVNHYLQQLPLQRKQPQLIKLSEPELNEAINIALLVLRESNFQQRWEVAKTFPKLGTKTIEPLLEILHNKTENWETRWFAINILGKYSNPKVVIALIELLHNSNDEELLEQVAEALINIGSHAIEALSRLLLEEEFRLLAVRSLAYIRRSETIQPLLTVINDPKPEIRAIAIEALGSFHNPQIPPILIQALQDETAQVRKEAVKALGIRAKQLSQFDLVKYLSPLLYDLSWEVCKQTAIALGRLGNEAAGKALFEVFQSPTTPDLLKIDIVRALGWIATEKVLGYFQQALSQSGVSVCQEIIVTLGRISKPELKPQAARILVHFFYSQQSYIEQPLIKQTLTTSLGFLGEKSAITLLTKLCQDPEQATRLHAIAALKKIPQSSQDLLSAESLPPRISSAFIP